jgi:tetratricopeptide (TPR) repeat protein
MYLASYLAKDPSFTTATLEQKLADLYKHSPNDSNVVYYYRRYLTDQKQYDQAIAIQSKYAESKATAKDLTYSYARSTLAELYGDKGDFKRALAYASTVAESYTETALEDMAHFNAALGKFDEAEDWAKKTVDRYEGAGAGLGVLCYVYWSEGKYDKAAQAMKDFKSPLTISILRNALADYFLLALGDKDSAEREKAITAIENAGLSDKLGNMGFYFRFRHRYDMVFEFEHHVKETGYQELRGPVICYNALSLAKNTSAALAWIKETIPAEKLPQLGPNAFRESEYALLDELVPYDDTTTQGRYNWTLRAAAVCADTTASKLMSEKVRKHFEADHSQDFQSVAGRFLIGLANRSDLDKSIKTQSDLCQAACYLGLMARAKGNYREASDWFLTSILTGQVELNEYQKSRLILAGWSAEGRSLDYLGSAAKKSGRNEFPGT